MNERSLFLRRRGLMRGLLACVGICASSVLAAQKATAVPADPKTHSVFVGIDLSVTLDGQPRRILGVSKSTAEVDMGAKIRRLSPEDFRGLFFERSIKVSREFVTLDELKVEPSFKSGGVVDQAWAQAVQTQWMGKTILDIAEGREDLDTQPPKVREMLREFEGIQGAKSLMGDLAKRQIEAGEVAHGALEDEARSRELFDALDVSFLASAPEPLFECYGVMVFTIRVGGVKPQVGQVVFFCEIGAIDSQPRRMKAQFSGVPPGFQFLRAEFHVYSHARELATNVAPNRVLLSERQANQFAILQYVAAQKGKTSPARVASAPPLDDALRKIADKELNLTLRFEITSTGEVKGISGSSPTKALHDHIASIQFYPAVDNGKAIASTLSISLGELLR
ncbi:MAG: hypothetical protein ABIZ81_10335 [Opitutaceae bacterium]